jgi:hypothetical protein
VGRIPSYFDPFVDNEIDPDANTKPESKVLSDDTVPDYLSSKSPFTLDIATSSSLNTAYMTDEGHAFPSVPERFG